MFGIRKKLMLGQGLTLAITAGISFIVMARISMLGDAIDVILKENYSSVRASLKMSEAVDYADRNLLYSVSGFVGADENAAVKSSASFAAALKAEKSVLTLPGEKEIADELERLFSEYEKTAAAINAAASKEEKLGVYFGSLLPLSEKIRALSEKILVMNQRNMNDANDAARRMAREAYNTLLMALVSAAALLALFGILITQWVLRPVDMLTDSAREIRNGNLNLVINNKNRDEIGRLSETFNDMAAALREARQSDRLDVIRTKRMAEEAFKALPVALAVVDGSGEIEFATEDAARCFGLRKGAAVAGSEYPGLYASVLEAVRNGRAVRAGESGWIQKFADGRERFFSPSAIPIKGDDGETYAAALVLDDVTGLVEQRELKRNAVSTVSHQLRTPLTSLRMSVYLLLDERTGPLNVKQEELLVAALNDGERLSEIIDDLLDIGRMESGRNLVNAIPVSPAFLASDASERFSAEAKTAGITLGNLVSDDLPEVAADASKIGHVFSNILENALRFTEPGGRVEIRAEEKDDYVRFEISDTGKGMDKKDIGRVFDMFYRGAGQSAESGVGLGLAIAREIVFAHGGEITASSEPGKGSVFSFTLKKASKPEITI